MFVRENDKGIREQLIKTLENDGFIKNEETPLSRIDIIDSNLPIIVNTLNKTYDRMGNVTCAAAAAGSGGVITIEEFYERYNNF